MEVPVGDQLLGRVVNALGQAIDGGEEIKTDKIVINNKNLEIFTNQSASTPKDDMPPLE